MSRLSCAFVALLIATPLGLASEPNAVKPAVQQNPELLLRTTLDGVLAVLRDKALDAQTRDKRINDLVTGAFDFPLMAQLSLGKPHWSQLSAPQQKKFNELFVQRLKDTYREKLTQYTDEKVVVKPATPKDKKAQIPTEVVSKDKTLAIVYSLYQAEKAWKIYDVQIEGISIIRTYRSQFDEVLNKGTVEDLLRQLEKPQDPNAPKR
jgi:phospholipid transport system substrate-binding protein